MIHKKPPYWQRFLVLSLLNLTTTPTVAEYLSYHQPMHYQQPVSIPPELQPYRPAVNPPQTAMTGLQSVQYARARSAPHRVQRQQQVQPGKQQRNQLLRTAHQYKGVRYRWGGNTPREGFDCSGFTKYSFKQINIAIPRTAAQQSRASRTIRRKELRPGDMIFFKTKGVQVNHVGIYTGNGYFIHAASGGGRVTVDNLRKKYWQKRLHKYGTFFS